MRRKAWGFADAFRQLGGGRARLGAESAACIGNPDWSDVAPDPGSSTAPWRIYNIGNNRPEELSRVVELLETEFGRKAEKELLPMQPGDVPETYADIDDLAREVDFRPATRIEDGIRRFAAWYRDYYWAGDQSEKDRPAAGAERY